MSSSPRQQRAWRSRMSAALVSLGIDSAPFTVVVFRPVLLRRRLFFSLNQRLSNVVLEIIEMISFYKRKQSEMAIGNGIEWWPQRNKSISYYREMGVSFSCIFGAENFDGFFALLRMLLFSLEGRYSVCPKLCRSSFDRDDGLYISLLSNISSLSLFPIPYLLLPIGLCISLLAHFYSTFR